MTVEEREDLNKEGGDVLYNPVEENSEIIENILLKDQKLVSFDSKETEEEEDIYDSENVDEDNILDEPENSDENINNSLSKRTRDLIAEADTLANKPPAKDEVRDKLPPTLSGRRRWQTKHL